MMHAEKKIPTTRSDIAAALHLEVRSIFFSAAMMNDIDGLLLHFHPAAASCLALPSACHASAAHIRAHAWQL